MRPAWADYALVGTCFSASIVAIAIMVCVKGKQTVADKYTGREFIVPNGALIAGGQGGSWEVLTLEPVADARYDLHSGYCR